MLKIVQNLHKYENMPKMHVIWKKNSTFVLANIGVNSEFRVYSLEFLV